MGKYELIATAALLCNFSSFGTLLYNVSITHDTGTLTYTWFYINILAQVLMIIYAVLNKAYGIYIPTAFLLAGLLYMLYIKSTFPSGQAKGLSRSKVTRLAAPEGLLREPNWESNMESKTGMKEEPKNETKNMFTDFLFNLNDKKVDEGFIY